MVLWTVLRPAGLLQRGPGRPQVGGLPSTDSGAANLTGLQPALAAVMQLMMVVVVMMVPAAAAAAAAAADDDDDDDGDETQILH